MFPNTPLLQPWQKAQAYPLYNPDKYCKMFFSGGLAQLVEQRTLKTVGRVVFQHITPYATDHTEYFSK
jgi:hypothetical protein